MDPFIIVDAPWRGYPATALALYGLALLAQGLWFGASGSSGLLKEREALGWLRGFRRAVVGLCLAGIAVAWAWQIPWLFIVSLGILGEELLETSVMIEVLRRSLEPHLLGDRIERVEVRNPALRETVETARLRRGLKGSAVVALRRRSKYLLIDLESGRTIVVHLGMSGRLTLVPAETSWYSATTARSRALCGR